MLPCGLTGCKAWGRWDLSRGSPGSRLGRLSPLKGVVGPAPRAGRGTAVTEGLAEEVPLEAQLLRVGGLSATGSEERRLRDADHALTCAPEDGVCGLWLRWDTWGRKARFQPLWHCRGTSRRAALLLSVEETRTRQGGGLQVWGLGFLACSMWCPGAPCSPGQLVPVPLVGPFVDPGEMGLHRHFAAYTVWLTLCF